MAIPNWGMLTKSQTDPETIEEAIARLIQQHNEDEEAHLGPGQSLQSHKASEIIDHLAASIIADKIKDAVIPVKKLNASNRIIISSCESFGGWMQNITGNGTIVAKVGQGWVGSGNQVNQYTECYIDVPDYGVLMTRNPLFQVTLRVINTAGEKYFTCYGRPYTSPGYYFGFKMSDANLYAVHYKDGVEYAEQITGVTITGRHTYRAQQFGGTKIEFYVDGVLKYTATTNIGYVGSDNRNLFVLSAKCTNGGSTGFYINNLLFQEDS